MALFNITAQQLKAQVDAARQSGLASTCATAEQARGLPVGLLLAIASRETNCIDQLGDGGHRRGVFQIDDRAHADWIAANVGAGGLPPLPAAADYAGSILASGLKAAKRLKLVNDAALRFAAAAYNAGEGGATRSLNRFGDPDRGTPHRNYGDDVVTRLHLIQVWLEGTPKPHPATVLPLLLPGARGRDVTEMKRRLREWFAQHPPTIEFADSPVYGSAAVDAVKEFQRRNGLLDDGKVGKDTWGALRGEAETPLTPAKQLPPAPARVSFPNMLYPRPNTWNGLQPWVIPQVEAICDRFKLTVSVGWSNDTAHKPRSDHKWGGAVDLVGAVDDMSACTFWADDYTSLEYRPGMVFRWVGGPAADASGVEPGHLDHVHLSWYREGPGTSIFTTRNFSG
jgi:hypothetical protein